MFPGMKFSSLQCNCTVEDHGNEYVLIAHVQNYPQIEGNVK